MNGRIMADNVLYSLDGIDVFNHLDQELLPLLTPRLLALEEWYPCRSPVQYILVSDL